VRIYRTEDGKHVPEGHVDAAFLAYSQYDVVPEEVLAELDDPDDDGTVQLNRMKADELKAYAAELGVDLTGLTKKADFVDAIREHSQKEADAQAEAARPELSDAEEPAEAKKAEKPADKSLTPQDNK
jgi:hypothetical protein